MSNTIKKIFPVTGMTCASCAASVESTLAYQKGVLKSAVNFADNSALVEYDEALTKPAELKKAVQSTGYDIDISENKSAEEAEAEKKKSFKKSRTNAVMAFTFAIPVFVLGMFFSHFEAGRLVSLILSAIVVFYFGRQFFIHSFKLLTHFKANMDTLVALSIGVSYFFSAFNTIFPQVLSSHGLSPDVYFESAAIITAFILLGRFFEEKAKAGTSEAIKNLIGLQAKTVKAIRNNTEQEIRIEDVLRSEIIIIRPGEKIPVDGAVISGNSFIDESMISGESLPVEKSIASKVFSGTINQKGSLTIKAEKIGKDTLLAQIIKTVREAQGSKAPVQKLVDKIAAVFVPVVLLIAVATFILWVSIGGKNYLAQGLISSLSVLVIACPCALGLATPTAIMVGVGKAAENGILIRNAEVFENTKNINTIVLDKTGTITKGKPEVTDIIWLADNSSKNYAPVLSVIESKSEHPLADAVVKYLAVKENPIDIKQFDAMPGKGVKAVTAAGTFYIGNEKLMSDKLILIFPEIEKRAVALKNEAKTVIYFSNESDLLAVIALADELKDTSADAIRELKKKYEVIMLTGDNISTAKAIAAKAGIENFKAQALPTDKAKFISELKAQGKKTAMVGDGINDSEALAVADISMAMGKGTDIAMNVADITLMRSDLKSILQSIHLSQKIVSTIRQNLFWAFVYNLVGIPIAAGVLYPFTGYQLSPMIAGAAMALSSISVVGNSLLLKSKSV